MKVQELDILGAPPRPLALARSALFLDLDGTLAPIAARPQDVIPDPHLTGLVERLERALEGRLAVVSGRSLADIDRILENRVESVAAVHGLARRAADGTVHAVTPHPALVAAVETFRQFAATGPGLLIEDKLSSVALHFRLEPQHGAEAEALAERVAGETGLVVQRGHMVVELRTPGPTKGDSVRTFMAGPPFAGAVPVFVGDDVTDEDGFAAAAELGGFGVLVGPQRRTNARWRVDDVDEALAWLESGL